MSSLIGIFIALIGSFELKAVGILSKCSATFTKGSNFRVFGIDSPANKALQKGVYSERNKFAPQGANPFL